MNKTSQKELSEKNKYYISKNRYYELLYFCRQYPIWKQAYESLDGMSKRPGDLALFSKANPDSNPTLNCAISMAYYMERIGMVQQAAKEADRDLADYIIRSVTEEDMSYDKMVARYCIPCSKDMFYDRRRKFFWILNKLRQ